jgi:hypothetical protein
MIPSNAIVKHRMWKDGMEFEIPSRHIEILAIERSESLSDLNPNILTDGAEVSQKLLSKRR